MEVKVNAVVIRAADYGEYDKILTLLTAEYGKISAGIKGIKKPAAKLKFAAQPFCFAEYVLAKRGDKYTVINCSETESFYDLRADVNKLYAAASAAEAASAVTYEGDGAAEVFYGLIETLSKMCAGDERPLLISFLLKLLSGAGYALAFDGCRECGRELSDDEILRFDTDTGSFTCLGCGTGAGVSRVTYNVLRKIAGKPYNESYITPDGEKRALKLLKEYFAYKTDSPLKSLSEYIRLI